MDNIYSWNVPIVCLPYKDSKRLRTIADARDAAHFLTFEWPWYRGHTHDSALRACGLVLGGFIAPDAARAWMERVIEETAVEMASKGSLCPSV